MYAGRPQQNLFEVRPHARRFESLLEHYRRRGDPESTGAKLEVLREADKEKAEEERSDQELASKEEARQVIHALGLRRAVELLKEAFKRA